MTTRQRKGKDTKVAKEKERTCEDEKIPESKFGPMPPSQRLWSRGVMVISVMLVVYFSSGKGKEVTLAKQSDFISHRGMEVKCSDDYKEEVEKFQDCIPKHCGRMVSDGVVTQQEVTALLQIASQVLALGGSDGGASILDLHSGALSYGDSFINIYKIERMKNILKEEDFEIYRSVKNKIHHFISHQFGVNSDKIYLTYPTFFSRMTAKPAKTLHDEYWHPHVDKQTYESFHYTSLIYLADYGKDFQGGRFIFVDKDNTNRTVEPRKGRVSAFTSGSENLHYVEKVSSGTRFALTVSFTCDKRYAIADPTV